VCSAEKILTHTNAPDDRLLNQKITLDEKSLRKNIIINSEEYLALNANEIDIEIKKDSQKNINKFHILIGYDLYMHGKNELPSQTLYIQCPVTRKTYIDTSTVTEKRNIKGSEITTFTPSSKVLKKEILDAGFYALSTSPREKKPILNSTFNNNEMSVEVQVNLICMNASIAYSKLAIKDHNRKITLREFELD